MGGHTLLGISETKPGTKNDKVLVILRTTEAMLAPKPVEVLQVAKPQQRHLTGPEDS